MKKLIALMMAVCLLASMMTFAAAEEQPVRRFKYKRTSMEVTVGDHTVKGYLYMPKNTDGPVPMVIACHGFGANHENLLYLCDKLARQGIASCTFDFWGGSAFSISGGSMADMSAVTEQQDLDAVVDYVAALDGVDAERICLMGHSQGGFVAVLEAVTVPEKIHALYLYAPALHIPEAMTAANPDPEKVEAVVSGYNTIGVRYVQDVWGMDIYAKMPTFPGKVLILHGDLDDAVSMSFSERAVEAFPDAALTVQVGASHTLPDPVQDVLIQMIADHLYAE